MRLNNSVRNDIINIIIFVISPVIGWLFALYQIARYNSKVAYLLNAIWGGMIGYAFRPTGMCDIINYWYEIDRLALIDMKDFFHVDMIYPILISLIFFLISKIGIKYLTSALYAFVCYGIYTYLVGDSLYQIKLSKYLKMVILVVTMFFVPMFSVFSSGRNMMAVYILLLAWYREFIRGEKDGINYILYGASILIHTTMIIYIIIYIVMKYFFNGKFGRIILLTNFAVVFAFAPSLYVFTQRLKGIGIFRYISRLTEILYNYTVNLDKDYIESALSRYNIITRIIITLLFVLCVLMMSYYRRKAMKKECQKNNGTGLFCSLVEVISFVGLGIAVFNPSPIFNRFYIIILPAIVLFTIKELHGYKVGIFFVPVTVFLMLDAIAMIYLYIHAIEFDHESIKRLLFIGS